MMKVKLQHLRFFVAVYEERSITAAAKRVNATQSGVSIQIRDFEAILGLKLFERTSSGVVPTKAGNQIFRRASRVLLEVGGLEEDVALHSGKLLGTVRAGIMPTFARSVLGPVLTRFAQENPLVDVKVTEGYSLMLTEMVVHGELDFAVVPGGGVPVGARSTYIDTDMEVLVMRRQSDHSESKIIDLASAPPLKLLLPGPGNARRSKIDDYLVDFCSSKHVVMELDSMLTTLDMIGKGEWSSVLPGALCIRDIHNPEVSLHPIVDPTLTVEYLLIEPASKASSAVVRLFAQTLSDEISLACRNCRDHFNMPLNHDRSEA